jgi:hypothetical protein
MLREIANSAQKFFVRIGDLGSTGCQPVLFGSLPKSA